MLLYALISGQIGEVIDLYATRQEAETVLRDALADEPEWEGVLHVAPFEFEVSAN